MARLLLAVVGLLQGWYAQGQTVAPIVIAPPTAAPVVVADTTPAPVAEVATTAAMPASVSTVPASLAPTYPDQQDPNCVVGQSCSTGSLVPTVRGLCVTDMGSNWCWDACNLKHPVTSYSTANQAGIALMVKQLRTGMRFGSCPGASFTPTCNPGERCTPPGSTWGRGMCTTQVGAGNQCLDMCNYKIPMDTFHDTPGKQAGTVQIVQMVRAGRDPAGLTTCPGASVWVWLWFPLLLFCSIGMCALAYWMFNFYRGRLKRGGNKGYREPEQPYVEEGQPYVDYDQVAPQDMDQMAPQDQYYGEEDPMPVVDQQDYGAVLAPAAVPVSTEPNLFEQPMLMPLAAGSVYAQQPLTTGYPTTYAAPMTMAPQMYQANSMSVSGAQGYTTTYQQAAMPQYVSQAAVPQYTSQMLAAPVTMQPYGAYGGATATTYPGTTSMRMG